MTKSIIGHMMVALNGKKRTAILLSLFMVLGLAACSQTDAPETPGSSQTNTENSIPESEDNTPESEGESNVSADSGNILIVYFSRYGNTNYPDDVDASTSASIVIDNERYGTTEYVSRMIQQAVGGDVHLIETTTPYTADFDELREVNHNEMQQNILPELKGSDLDISKYDTVFIGYPVWATDVPQAVLSFLNEYDLTGKTVIPFCTHDGYGAGESYQTIAVESKAEKTLEGLAIEAKDVPSAQDTVTNWLNAIGVKKAGSSAGNGETAIKITVGDVDLDGVLYNTALAQEIKAYFPLTISMVGYGGREYYGGVDFYPEHLEGGQRTFENGDITYCEAHHNMAIFYAQTDNPNLSVDVIPVGKITSDLSVFADLSGSVQMTFELDK